MKPLTDGHLEIIYYYAKPLGIRDGNGFLFFFSDIPKYTGQEERYSQEIEQQCELANFLLSALNANTEESKPDRTFGGEFRPETVLAELTQFNDDGNKIAHFVYTLPDLNPQPKQESKLCPECDHMMAQMHPEPSRWDCPNCGFTFFLKEIN
jgi:ribosomal protein S27AE